MPARLMEIDFRGGKTFGVFILYSLGVPYRMTDTKGKKKGHISHPGAVGCAQLCIEMINHFEIQKEQETNLSGFLKTVFRFTLP